MISIGYRTARLKANRKVNEVAEHMGVSRISVFQWETGMTNPTAGKLVKLADFYGCTVDELLQGNPISEAVQNNGQ